MKTIPHTARAETWTEGPVLTDNTHVVQLAKLTVPVPGLTRRAYRQSPVAQLAGGLTEEVSV